MACHRPVLSWRVLRTEMIRVHCVSRNEKCKANARQALATSVKTEWKRITQNEKTKLANTKTSTYAKGHGLEVHGKKKCVGRKQQSA
ncbi:hypothetical protein BCR44DRAFT_1046014 [Catenaria anguillulae PL171]|uniref:Uncharacterized protein n=1 Tax=Catenaria anguillulae PL171 TaxID=765915 RepID=A0A1Y2H6Y8_9FUNG|nr:hypothetical protein BCR44DRAFT_1046014 [Catenaria anguillulae PL171]